MVVVLTIIITISAIALFGQSSFNRSLVLTDTSYSVAFSVREAQALGISSRTFSGTANAGYGLHFSSNGMSSYRLFADLNPSAPGDMSNPTVCPGHTESSGPEAKPGDCIQTQASEIVRTYSLNNGFRLKSFCGTPTGGGTRWCSDTPGREIFAMNILYMRPDTLSVITGITSSATSPPLTSRVSLQDATLRIQSPDGTAERCVFVSKVGQVSVHALGDTECP